MPAILRAYCPADRSACLKLFDSNIPEFFRPHERAEFENWLNAPGEYLVIENAGEMVACGGVWQEGNRAGLAWGIVARHQHRQGFGTVLLLARLKRLRELGARQVDLNTMPHTAPFFERYGFQVTRNTPDGYGLGQDRVDMVCDLAT